MVVTSRIFRDLLATDVVPDVLVGSARDPARPSGAISCPGVHA